MSLIGIAAGTTQMLHPRVMRMIDQASTFREDPHGRGVRTGQYILLITYGDVATAERAGGMLRKRHQSVIANDPETGERYDAEVPELLQWVHNALTWSALRGFEHFGPRMTSAQKDQYVFEQRIAARLVGVPDDLTPSTVAELDAYMNAMLPRLSVIHAALWLRDMMVSKGQLLPLGVAATAERIMKDAAITTMLPEHRQMFGLEFSKLRERTARAGARMLLSKLRKTPYEERIAHARSEADRLEIGPPRTIPRENEPQNQS